MSKKTKVIEQKNDYPIEIEIQADGENDGVYLVQTHSKFEYNDIWINQENAREVALAIDTSIESELSAKDKEIERLKEFVKEVSEWDNDNSSTRLKMWAKEILTKPE